MQMEELRLKNLEVAGDDDLSDEDEVRLENGEEDTVGKEAAAVGTD